MILKNQKTQMLKTEGQNDLSIYHRYNFPTLKYF